MNKTRKKRKKSKDLGYYMSLNYPLTAELYEEEGKTRFGLEVPELLGVWASGETIEEAYASLVESKRAWFEVRLKKGMEIPEPVSEEDFSGKFLLRIPAKLHMALSKQSKANDLSLNQYVKSLLEKPVSLQSQKQEIQDREDKLLQALELLTTEVRRLKERVESLENIQKWDLRTSTLATDAAEYGQRPVVASSGTLTQFNMPAQ